MLYRTIFLWAVILCCLSAPAGLRADVTYWLDGSVPADVAASVQEAVAIYNKYGSFNKHLSVFFNTGVPTAQANYDGVITFGGSRNTRVALHEMGHTVGIGTFWRYGELMSGGVWQGFYGRRLGIAMGGYADGVHGDGTHIWPWGLNYDNEDGFMERIRHVRIMAAMRCDMGIMAYSREAEHQVVPLGGTAQFRIESPLATACRWYKNGTALSNGGDISGATGPVLQIANVDTTDVGSYHCAATGAGETLNSRPRRLIIQEFTGRWEFENNALDSIHSYDGTVSGSPVYTAGKIGRALDLDGADDFITLPADVALAEDMTIAAWVYWDGGNQWQRIFDFGTSTSQNMFLTPRSGGNTLRFAVKDGGGEQIVESSQLPAGQWVHVAVTLRDDTATLFVNGRAVDTNDAVTIDPIDFQADRNYIGKSQYPDPLFNGRIDDFRIYNYALRGAEIWDLWGQNANRPPQFTADPITLPAGMPDQFYSSGMLSGYAEDADADTLTFGKISGSPWLQVAADGTLSGTPTHNDTGVNECLVRVTDPSGASDETKVSVLIPGSLVACYPFENTYADATVNGTDAVPSGSPVFTAGHFGRSVDLDGTSDYLNLPTGIADTENITVAAWVYWDGGNDWQRIFDFGNDTDHNMFLTPRSGSGTLRFAIKNGGGEQQLNAPQLAAGQWVHVAVTIDGQTGTLYINGNPAAINSDMTLNPIDISPLYNYIGKSQWPDPLFNGRVDDFRIYHYALSSDQIGALASGSSIPAFTADPIHLQAVELQSQSGLSLADFANDLGGLEPLIFTKETGPAWLTVLPDGGLSGIPGDADVGANAFTVRVATPSGLSDTATLTVDVANIYSGLRGLMDLAGLASHWLAAGCMDTPACGGADLTGDTAVDMADLSMLAGNWLADETLALYLPLDENAGDSAEDASIYARSAVLVNGPAWTSGITGGALAFDGIDDYVAVSGYKGITGTADRTCTAWIKTASPGMILSWGDEQAGQKWTFRVEADGTLGVGVWGGYIHTAAAVNDNQWHHVAAVLADDGSPDVSEIQLYIDGVLQAASANSTQPVDTGIGAQDVLIGTFENAGVLGNWFQGAIDDVRIYTRALNDTEISQIPVQ